MNLQVSVKSLLNVLEKAIRATGKNLSLPVLACFNFVADKSGTLSIKSTNLDLGADFNLKVKCVEGGNLAVPASTLLNLITTIKQDSNLEIKEVEGNLSITSHKNSSIIKCQPVEDFPNIPNIFPNKETSIKPKDLIGGIKSVWYSASNSSIKPELSSVYIYPGEQELVFVSSDSFRLAEKKVYYKKPIDFQPILIPSKNIPDIFKIIEGYDDEIRIVFDKNQIGFHMPDGSLVSRVVDGSFPDYKQVIPKSFHVEATLLKNDLVSTIKSAQVFSDAFNQIRFKVDGKKGKVVINTKNSDVGEYSEDIAAKISGEDIEIGFNHKYILDAIQSIDADSLTLSFAGSGKPMIMRGVNDQSFTYMVSPMNR